VPEPRRKISGPDNPTVPHSVTRSQAQKHQYTAIVIKTTEETIEALADALGCSQERAKEWLDAIPVSFVHENVRRSWMGGKAPQVDDADGSWSNVVRRIEG